MQSSIRKPSLALSQPFRKSECSKDWFSSRPSPALTLTPFTSPSRALKDQRCVISGITLSNGAAQLPLLGYLKSSILAGESPFQHCGNWIAAINLPAQVSGASANPFTDPGVLHSHLTL